MKNASMTIVATLAVSTAMLTPSVAGAATLLFTLSGANEASFDLDSKAAVDYDPSSPYLTYDVTVDYDGGLLKSGLLYFFSGSYGGGLVVDHPGQPQAISLYGDGLFASRPDSPEFTPGSYAFASAKNGPQDTTLVISELAASVPEPMTWAMMIAGFGAMGAVMRARRNVEVRFA